MTRPSFITTKGERGNSNPHSFNPLHRYKSIAMGIYEWTGLPDDVPLGFIEGVLFEVGCISAKSVEGLGICVLPASPSTLTLYGEPSNWLPTRLYSFPSSLPDLTATSTNPCLYLGESTLSKIEMFVSIMNNSLLSLNQNIVAMRQPIALDGSVGNGADAVVLSKELDGGEMYIPVIDASKLGVHVLDLKAQDHTQSLISTYNAMDSEILNIIGVKNVGSEKASGITSEETLSIKQELVLTSDIGLRLRERWCERINTAIGTGFSVKLSEAYTEVDDNKNGTPDTLEKVPEVI